MKLKTNGEVANPGSKIISYNRTCVKTLYNMFQERASYD